MLVLPAKIIQGRWAHSALVHKGHIMTDALWDKLAMHCAVLA